MKLLFDQNLSWRLCRSLAKTFPKSEQVHHIGLAKASDEAIWEFARREGFVLVTLDSDFADIAALRGAPPKVIWLRCGNQETEFIEDLLREHAAVIEEFEAANGDVICLELY